MSVRSLPSDCLHCTLCVMNCGLAGLVSCTFNFSVVGHKRELGNRKKISNEIYEVVRW